MVRRVALCVAVAALLAIPMKANAAAQAWWSLVPGGSAIGSSGGTATTPLTITKPNAPGTYTFTVQLNATFDVQNQGWSVDLFTPDGTGLTTSTCRYTRIFDVTGTHACGNGAASFDTTWDVADVPGLKASSATNASTIVDNAGELALNFGGSAPGTFSLMRVNITVTKPNPNGNTINIFTATGGALWAPTQQVTYNGSQPVPNTSGARTNIPSIVIMNQIPEPGTMGLLGLGLALALRRRRA